MSGQFNETKNALKSQLESIIPEATVTGNWRDVNKLISRTRNLPVISVRFIKERIWSPYDTPDISEMEADYHFSLFIFHSNCMESGYDKAHYAYNLADRIKNGLFPNPPVIGWDIEMVSCREIEPAGGAHRISRVVIEGRINIQRID